MLQRQSERMQRRGVTRLLAGVSADHRLGRQLRAFGCFREDPCSVWYPVADRVVEFSEGRLLAGAGRSYSDVALAPDSRTLFRGLGAARTATLRVAVRPRTLADGQTLFRQGDPADALYLLTRGSITITAASGSYPAKRRCVSFSAGTMLCETAMLGGCKCGARATADGPVELLQLGSDAAEPRRARNGGKGLSRKPACTCLRPDQTAEGGITLRNDGAGGGARSLGCGSKVPWRSATPS